MKRIILVVCIMLLLAACDNQGDNAAPTVNLNMTLDVMPDPPTVGETMLMITLQDAEGNLIDDATVAVHGDMDHDGMIPVDATTSDNQGGVYHVPFAWSMGGGWIVDISATLPDNRGLATERFEVFVEAVSQDSIINQHRDMTDAAAMIRYSADNGVLGDDTVSILVTMSDGMPINDAHVTLHGTMPEHEMMPITAEIMSGEHGRYALPVRWTMAGDWHMIVTITLADGSTVSETFVQNIVMNE